MNNQKSRNLDTNLVGSVLDVTIVKGGRSTSPYEFLGKWIGEGQPLREKKGKIFSIQPKIVACPARLQKKHCPCILEGIELEIQCCDCCCCVSCILECISPSRSRIQYTCALPLGQEAIDWE